MASLVRETRRQTLSNACLVAVRASLGNISATRATAQHSTTPVSGEAPEYLPAGLGRVTLLHSGRHTRGVHEGAGRGFALIQHAHIVIIAVLYTRTTVALALPRAPSHTRRSSPFLPRITSSGPPRILRTPISCLTPAGAAPANKQGQQRYVYMCRTRLPWPPCYYANSL